MSHKLDVRFVSDDVTTLNHVRVIVTWCHILIWPKHDVKNWTCACWDSSSHTWAIAIFRFSLLSKSVVTWNYCIYNILLYMLFCYFWFSYNIVKFQTCSSLHSWVIGTLRLSLLSKSVVTWNYCIYNILLYMLFCYFWFSYNIVKFQTCSSLHSWVIGTLRLSLLSKSVVTRKLLHLQYFVKICCSPTFGSAIR